MYRQICFLICVLCSVCAPGQVTGRYLIDSVRAAELDPSDKAMLDSVMGVYHRQTNDTARLKQLVYLAEYLQDERLWLSYNRLVISYCDAKINDKAAEKREKAFYLAEKAFALNNEGLYQAQYRGDYIRSVAILEEALRIFEPLGHEEGLGVTYGNIATAYEFLTQYERCLYYYNKSLELALKTGDLKVQGYAYSNIASVQTKFGDEENSRKNYYKSIGIRKKLNNNTDLSNSYRLLGQAYVSGKPDSALYCFKMSEGLARKAGYAAGIYKVYRELGAYWIKRNSDTADYYLGHSFRLALQHRDSVFASYVISAYASLKYHQQRYREVVDLVGKNIRWVEAMCENTLLGNIYEVLAGSYEQLGNYRASNAYLRLLIKTRLKQFNDESRVRALKQQYIMDFKTQSLEDEKNAKQKEMTLAYEKRISRLTLSGTILIALITLGFGIVILNRYSKIKRQNATIREQYFVLNQERSAIKEKNDIIEESNLKLIRAIETLDELKNINTIFKLEQQLLRNQINPHFVFNSLNSIQKLVLNNDSLNAYDYITKFSKLLRKTLQTSDQILNSLSEELDNLKVYIELEMLRFENRFFYSVNVSQDLRTDCVKIPILLIQPFVENAIWHGLMNLPQDQPGELRIEVYSQENILQIIVIDNGVGLEATRQKGQGHESHGLNISFKRLESINFLMRDRSAHVTIAENRPRGTIAHITIPIFLS